MNTPNFTVDLTTLKIPGHAKCVTQDQSGRVDAWSDHKVVKGDRSWHHLDGDHVGTLIASDNAENNPNWRDAITDWPMPVQQPAKWDGNGLPPVGTHCEAFDRETGDFEKVEIVAYDTGYVWMRRHAYGPGQRDAIRVARDVDFRLPRTARDDAIDDIMTALEATEFKPARELRGHIYDAIAAGKVRGVMVDNGDSVDE